MLHKNKNTKNFIFLKIFSILICLIFSIFVFTIINCLVIIYFIIHYYNYIKDIDILLIKIKVSHILIIVLCSKYFI